MTQLHEEIYKRIQSPMVALDILDLKESDEDYYHVISEFLNLIKDVVDDYREHRINREV